MAAKLLHPFFLIFLCILFLVNEVAISGERKYSLFEIHTILNDMVRQFNTKMGGTKVDDMTTIRMMTYDENGPTLGYFYSISYFEDTGKHHISPQHAKLTRDFNIEKTCSSPFRALMSDYGLKVVHIFSDSTTGRNLLEVRVSSKDCKSFR
jgi:hypothetical protein